MLIRLASLYVAFAAFKRTVPLPTLARIAWADPKAPLPRRPDAAVAGLTRLHRFVGIGRGDCLQSALVLYRELSRAGADPRLVMGFARDADGVTGHAWVEVDGCPVAERVEAVQRFTRTACFGQRGRRLPVDG